MSYGTRKLLTEVQYIIYSLVSGLKRQFYFTPESRTEHLKTLSFIHGNKMDFIVCHESLLLFRKSKSLARYNNNIYILKQRFLTKKKIWYT